MTDDVDNVPGEEPEGAEDAKPDSEDTSAPEENDGEDAAAEDAEEGEGEGEEKSEDEPKPKAKPKGGFQRRISELTANLRKAERERELLLQRVLDGQQTSQPKQTQQQQPPKQEDFDNYQDYLDARTEYLVSQRVDAALSQMRTQQQRTAAQQRQQQAMQAYDAKVAEARAEYEDFDDVAFSEVPITQDMAQAILESDVGPKVQYFLGSHPDEAQRIARLSPYGQVREIGKLEAKLSSPPPKKTTQAGKPLKPVAGQGANGGKVDPDKLPIEEWMKRANEGTLKY